MRFKIVFSIAVIALAALPAKVNAGEAISGKLPYVNVSWGLLNYKGDLSKIESIGNFHNPTFGVEASLSYVFWNTLGLELHGLYGTLSHEQNTTAILHNFRTTMIGGGLNLAFRMDNGFIFPVDSKFAPFVYIGATPFGYWAQGDLVDGNGERYHYWSDGSIRNINEEAPDADNAKVLRRNYSYETSYRGFNGDDILALAFNVGGGFTFEITNWLEAQLRVSYSMTNSDFVDGYEGGSDKDNYIFGNFGLTLDPNAFLVAIKGGSEEEGEDIDVDDFLSIDSDGDGIPDLDDKCSGTPLGTAVGSDGCAKVNPEEATVDSLSSMSDSLVVLRKNLCRDYPMLCGEGEEEYLELDGRSDRSIKMQQQEKAQDFPDELPVDKIMQVADFNKDGKVELPELYSAIEAFFDGTSDISLKQLRKLIDHFFDQY